MTKRIAVAIAAVLIMSAMAATQQTTFGQTSRESAPSAKKLVSLSGRVSDDGKTLVTPGDGTTWTVVNPETLADDFGARVVVRGHVDAASHQIEVTSVRVDTAAGARLRDAAFRR